MKEITSYWFDVLREITSYWFDVQKRPNFKQLFCATCRFPHSHLTHRHSNSGPPFFLLWSLPRLWYGYLSGSISLNHLSIFYDISCYNSLVLIIFVSRSRCRFAYICIKVRNNRQNTKRESSLRLNILQ